jgi:CheY-like chemotaxis protein
MKNNHILLIDDDDVSNLIIQTGIQKLNNSVHITTYQIAQEALIYLKQNLHQLPSLTLLDINMPLMNGWEFLEQLVNLDISMKVAIVTSSINENDQFKSRSYEPVKGYFVKPFQKQDLLKILDMMNP